MDRTVVVIVVAASFLVIVALALAAFGRINGAEFVGVTGVATTVLATRLGRS